jgi:hypothetical protein
MCDNYVRFPPIAASLGQCGSCRHCRALASSGRSSLRSGMRRCIGALADFASGRDRAESQTTPSAETSNRPARQPPQHSPRCTQAMPQPINADQVLLHGTGPAPFRAAARGSRPHPGRGGARHPSPRKGQAKHGGFNGGNGILCRRQASRRLWSRPQDPLAPIHQEPRSLEAQPGSSESSSSASTLPASTARAPELLFSGRFHLRQESRLGLPSSNRPLRAAERLGGVRPACPGDEETHDSVIRDLPGHRLACGEVRRGRVQFPRSLAPGRLEEKPDREPQFSCSLSMRHFGNAC